MEKFFSIKNIESPHMKKARHPGVRFIYKKKYFGKSKISDILYLSYFSRFFKYNYTSITYMDEPKSGKRGKRNMSYEELVSTKVRLPISLSEELKLAAELRGESLSLYIRKIIQGEAPPHDQLDL